MASEAIERAREHMPDLILLDVMMPHVRRLPGGARAAASLSSRRHIPIIMLTAKAEIEDRLHGLRATAPTTTS